MCEESALKDTTGNKSTWKISNEQLERKKICISGFQALWDEGEWIEKEK